MTPTIKEELENDLAQFNATFERTPESKYVVQRYYGVDQSSALSFGPDAIKLRLYINTKEDWARYIEAYPPGPDFGTESASIELFDAINRT